MLLLIGIFLVIFVILIFIGFISCVKYEVVVLLLMLGFVVIIIFLICGLESFFIRILIVSCLGYLFLSGDIVL